MFNDSTSSCLIFNHLIYTSDSATYAELKMHLFIYTNREKNNNGEEENDVETSGLHTVQ